MKVSKKYLLNFTTFFNTSRRYLFSLNEKVDVQYNFYLPLINEGFIDMIKTVGGRKRKRNPRFFEHTIIGVDASMEAFLENTLDWLITRPLKTSAPYQHIEQGFSAPLTVEDRGELSRIQEWVRDTEVQQATNLTKRIDLVEVQNLSSLTKRIDLIEIQGMETLKKRIDLVDTIGYSVGIVPIRIEDIEIEKFINTKVPVRVEFGGERDLIGYKIRTIPMELQELISTPSRIPLGDILLITEPIIEFETIIPEWTGSLLETPGEIIKPNSGGTSFNFDGQQLPYSVLQAAGRSQYAENLILYLGDLKLLEIGESDTAVSRKKEHIYDAVTPLREEGFLGHVSFKLDNIDFGTIKIITYDNDLDRPVFAQIPSLRVAVEERPLTVKTSRTGISLIEYGSNVELERESIEHKINDWAEIERGADINNIVFSELEKESILNLPKFGLVTKNGIAFIRDKEVIFTNLVKSQASIINFPYYGSVSKAISAYYMIADFGKYRSPLDDAFLHESNEFGKLGLMKDLIVEGLDRTFPVKFSEGGTDFGGISDATIMKDGAKQFYELSRAVILKTGVHEQGTSFNLETPSVIEKEEIVEVGNPAVNHVADFSRTGARTSVDYPIDFGKIGWRDGKDQSKLDNGKIGIRYAALPEEVLFGKFNRTIYGSYTYLETGFTGKELTYVTFDRGMTGKDLELEGFTYTIPSKTAVKHVSDVSRADNYAKAEQEKPIISMVFKLAELNDFVSTLPTKAGEFNSLVFSGLGGYSGGVSLEDVGNRDASRVGVLDGFSKVSSSVLKEGTNEGFEIGDSVFNYAMQQENMVLSFNKTSNNIEILDLIGITTGKNIAASTDDFVSTYSYKDADSQPNVKGSDTTQALPTKAGVYTYMSESNASSSYNSDVEKFVNIHLGSAGGEVENFKVVNLGSAGAEVQDFVDTLVSGNDAEIERFNDVKTFKTGIEDILLGVNKVVANFGYTVDKLVSVDTINTGILEEFKSVNTWKLAELDGMQYSRPTRLIEADTNEISGGRTKVEAITEWLIIPQQSVRSAEEVELRAGYSFKEVEGIYKLDATTKRMPLIDIQSITLTKKEVLVTAKSDTFIDTRKEVLVTAKYDTFIDTRKEVLVTAKAEEPIPSNIRLLLADIQQINTAISMSAEAGVQDTSTSKVKTLQAIEVEGFTDTKKEITQVARADTFIDTRKEVLVSARADGFTDVKKEITLVAAADRFTDTKKEVLLSGEIEKLGVNTYNDGRYVFEFINMATTTPKKTLLIEIESLVSGWFTEVEDAEISKMETVAFNEGMDVELEKLSTVPKKIPLMDGAGELSVSKKRIPLIDGITGLLVSKKRIPLVDNVGWLSIAQIEYRHSDVMSKLEEATSSSSSGDLVAEYTFGYTFNSDIGVTFEPEWGELHVGDGGNSKESFSTSIIATPNRDIVIYDLESGALSSPEAYSDAGTFSSAIVSLPEARSDEGEFTQTIISLPEAQSVGNDMAAAVTSLPEAYGNDSSTSMGETKANSDSLVFNDIVWGDTNPIKDAIMESKTDMAEPGRTVDAEMFTTTVADKAPAVLSVVDFFMELANKGKKKIRVWRQTKAKWSKEVLPPGHGENDLPSDITVPSALKKKIWLIMGKLQFWNIWPWKKTR